MEHRSFPVPDGLDGVRVDQGLAKLLGFSRTHAADIAAAGGAVLDGASVDKSDRLRAGGWLEVSWQPPRTLEVEPIAVPDLGIVHDDDDLVVVDKPAGVAAHPSRRLGRADGRRAPSPPPDSASRRRAPPSARASCTASTRARAA